MCINSNPYQHMIDKQFVIPVYIINLEYRTDRRVYIKEQFEDYPEFKVHFFNAIKDQEPAVGLYRSLREIVKIAQTQDLPYVVICEDDHKFTDAYNKDIFFEYLNLAKRYSADVLLGGVSWFDCGVRVEDNLYWLKNFTGTQFLVIYDSFYKRLLDTPFQSDDVIDAWMWALSDRIFVTVPMLSVQYDFGYSDVTSKNNRIGRIDELFRMTSDRWQVIREVTDHVREKLVGYKAPEMEENVQLPTYVINLAHRKDRLSHIKSELDYREEFQVHIVDAVNENNGAIGLWKSVVKVIQKAKDQEDEVILICEDDHVFCNGYDKNVLWDAIYQGAYLGADLILGGISSAEQIIPVSDCLCWISSFQCTQFTIIYHHFFDTILSSDFGESDAADLKLSTLTANKYVIHPFISEQKDFGYSDIPVDNFGTEHYKMKFDYCSAKIDKVRSVSQLVESQKN